MEIFLTVLFIAFIWALIEKGSPKGRLRRMERRVKYLEERERKREKQEDKEKNNNEDITYFR